MQPSSSEKTKQLIQKGFIGIFVFGVLGFIGFKLYPIIHGPVITVATLTNGGTVQEPMIRVSGTASFTQQLIVNGKTLALSPDGSFDEKLVLNPGYNLVMIQGADRFGKTKNQNYAVVLAEKTPPQTLTMNTVTPTHIDNH
jgi:uncharacterized protein YfaP (DUF2135 family)